MACGKCEKCFGNVAVGAIDTWLYSANKCNNCRRCDSGPVASTAVGSLGQARFGMGTDGFGGRASMGNAAAAMVGAEPLPSVEPEWAHSDRRGFDIAIKSGLARLTSMDTDKAAADAWPAGNISAVSDLRAILVAAALSANWLRVGGSYPLEIYDSGTDEAGNILPQYLFLTDIVQSDFFDVNAYVLAYTPLRALKSAWEIAKKSDPTILDGLVEQFRTVEGGVPIPLPGGATVGAAPVALAWPAAACIITGILVVGYIAEKGLQIESQHLARNDATARMIAAAGEAIKLSKQHLDAEAAAAKPLPLNQIEVDTLKNLNTSIDKTNETFAIASEPLPSIFPDTTKIVTKAVDVTGDIAKTATLGLGAYAAIAAVLVGGYYVFTMAPAASHKKPAESGDE